MKRHLTTRADLKVGPYIQYVTAAALLAAIAMPAAAHHSVAGMFDETKEVTVTGTIAKIDWINPHIYVFVDVKDDAGKVTTWTFETLPPAMLRRAGLTQALLGGSGVGKQQVTVKALPARVNANTGLITIISYPDGHHYQLFQSGRPEAR
jgi:uncharacterized protein DUF6152